MYTPLPVDTLELNVPVPVNIWDPRGALLLRKGEAIVSEQHREYLLQHSPVVKDADFQAWTYSYKTQLDRMVRGNAPLSQIMGLTRPAELLEQEAADQQEPAVAWPDLHASLTTLLHQGPAATEFVDRLLRIERRVLQVLESNTDSSLFVLVQLLFERQVGYSATHALLCSAVCHLVAPAAGLSPAEASSLFRAALCMNIGMARLHDDLARQAKPPSEAQREVINGHPLHGAQLLRALGVGDPVWLRLIEHHQDTLTGGDTPVAQRLLRMADVFVARISPRQTRSGLLAHQVAKDIYLGPDGQPNPLGALFIKTVGIYPPGCYVRLASGEVGVVVRRGRRANAPVVFAIINKQGMPLGEPALRDTLDRAYETKGAVSADEVKVVINVRKLLARA